MKSPTSRQLQVLRVITEHVDRFGTPPSLFEMLERLGLEVNVNKVKDVRQHLAALERKGLLERHYRKHRTYTLTEVGARWACFAPQPVLGPQTTRPKGVQ